MLPLQHSSRSLGLPPIISCLVLGRSVKIRPLHPLRRVSVGAGHALQITFVRIIQRVFSDLWLFDWLYFGCALK